MVTILIKFIDSARFMATSLSNLVDHVTEEIAKLNMKIVIDFLCVKESRIFR